MRSAVSTYGFINAKLRARISKMLPDSVMKALVQATSLNETLALLRNTSYNFLDETFTRSGDLRLAELELLRSEILLYTDVVRYLSGPAAEFVRALTMRFEIENLKNALRVFFDRVVRQHTVETATPYLLFTRIVTPVDADSISKAESVQQVRSLLAPTPYAAVIDQPLMQLEATASLFRTEVALDRFFYQQVLEKAEGLATRDKAIVHRLIGAEIDLQNINWILRLKTYHTLPPADLGDVIISGGASRDPRWLRQAYESTDMTAVMKGLVKPGDAGLSTLLSLRASETGAKLALIESLIEQILLREVHRILGSYPFTIGIVLCYFVLKGREMKRLRTILNAKMYDVPAQRIEELL